MSNATTSVEFFEAKYQQNPDPWDFAGSIYEQGRYDVIIRSLPCRRFQKAFEAGCSIGVLTERLASLCESVYALDVSVTAVARARERCLHLANVEIEVGSLLTHVPKQTFDLIVLSEIGYYFQPAQLTAIAKSLIEQLSPNGILLGAHWLGHSRDHILSGDHVHEIVGRLPGLNSVLSERHGAYRLDHWTKQ